MSRQTTIALAVSLFASCGSARAAAPLVERTPPLTSAAARGHIVFDRHCSPCHPNGAAGLGPALNNKPLVGPAIRLQVRQGIGAMPGFDAAMISEADLDDLVEYIEWVGEVEVSSRR